MEAQSTQVADVSPCTFCRGERDPNVWGSKNTEKSDKNAQRCSNCQVFKSGHLFISSKGIGWTSWKRRWFMLTSTSLNFFRSDPLSPSQRGEVNLTLGGIDLNNSGSVVARADKKLLTVQFPDGRDARTFTLKAETLEDLNEWKTALESVLAQAPNAALVVGQTGIFRNEVMEAIEASTEPCVEKITEKSIIGRPILLALEETDGSPSFLEKALRFIEQHGIRVEGILRQSADVEEVERRVQEYEKGKKEFDANEDAHVIGDCIKYVLRELPSSPVPAASCMALVEALRSDRRTRISSMRNVISTVLPEPNRRLLQRILRMMKIVESHRAENRMALSAVAACMAPLLLRALLAGDCELEEGMDIGGDGSMQLLKAAAAANHAQAIVIILLEAYEKIFDDDAFSSELCTDSEECCSDDEEDDDEDDDGDDDEDDDDDGEESTDGEINEIEGYHDAQNELGQLAEEVLESTTAGPLDESGIDLCDNKTKMDHINSKKDSQIIHQSQQSDDVSTSQENPTTSHNNGSQEQLEGIHSSPSPLQPSLIIDKLIESSNAPGSKVRPPTRWGRTSARKNLSMESIDYSVEEDYVIQRLETTKNELQVKIAKEEQENVMLQASLGKRKGTLQELRMALEEDVKKLQEQLRKEKELRACLEAGLMNMRPGHISLSSQTDFKSARENLKEIAMAESDVIHLKQKVSDLRGQLGQHLCPSCGQQLREQPKRVYTLSNIPPQRNFSSGEANESTPENNHVDLEDQSDEVQGNSLEGKPTSNEMPSDSKNKSLEDREEGQVKASVEEKSMAEKQEKDRAPPPKNSNSKSEAQDHNDASATPTTLASPSSSTVSTLSRLTNRLNFLKERRTQLANDLQQATASPTKKPGTPSRRTNSS